MLLSTDPAIHRGLCQIARDARKGSVKFAPEMKKNRASAAPACAPLGMDAFTRAQYEWGCGLPQRSRFAASLRQAAKTFVQ